MCQHAQLDLLLLVDPRAGAQGRAQQLLVAREAALDVPPLAVDPAVPRPGRPPPEPPHHLPAVLRLRPPPTRVPAVQSDHRRPDPQAVAGQGVVGLGVVPGVAQERVQRAPAARRPHRRPELGRVLARPAADVGGQEQVAAGLQHGRQLGPAPLPPPAAAPGEVAADVAGLVPGRIDRRPRLRRDQAALARPGDGVAEEGVGPFFSSSRAAAFWRVEWSGTLASPRAARRSDQSVRNCSSPR
jgi:hypothetical protein